MENLQIKNAFRELLVVVRRGNIVDTQEAIRVTAGRVGGRQGFIKLLGINQSTYTRYLNGTGYRGLRDRLFQYGSVGKEALAQQFSDSQLQAMAATGIVSAGSLSFLIRIKEAAGFDLSQKLYEDILKEFRCQNVR